MPRAGLTPEAVVAEAARVADTVGYERLTLAAIAEHFGVALPSLYKHVNGLEAVRTGLAVRALRELASVLADAAAGRSRREALQAVAAAYRGYARAHPGSYGATLRAPDPADAAHVQASDEVLHIVFAMLANYELGGDDAVDATRALRAVLHGFVALEAAGGFGMPQDVDRSFQRLVDGFDASLAQWGARVPTAATTEEPPFIGSTPPER
jgi:AcrR family transcriptional regulator